MVDWHARMQRSQHLAIALADMGHVCIYLNPHLGLEYLTPALVSPEARLSAISPGIYELHVHLPAEHAVDSRMPTRTEIERIVVACRQVVLELGINHAYQIVSTPAWLGVVTRLRELFGFPLLYDCHDYLSGFHRLAREIIDWESSALEQCDLAMFSSRHLVDLHAVLSPGLASKALLLRNANRPEDFARHPPVALGKSRPTVGYVGSLDHWFDVELVRAVVQLQPEYDFVFAGRIEDSRIYELKRYPNIRFVGEIAYKQVPEFLQRCHAGIIPFERIPLTLSTNPVKLYEYFSAGLPVVSTRLPEVEMYGSLVYLADTPGEFSTRLTEAINERDSTLRNLRIRTGHSESWKSRAEDLLVSLRWFDTPAGEAGYLPNRSRVFRREWTPTLSEENNCT